MQLPEEMNKDVSTWQCIHMNLWSLFSCAEVQNDGMPLSQEYKETTLLSSQSIKNNSLHIPKIALTTCIRMLLFLD